MISLKCKKCGRKWVYNGSKRFYTTCPDCKTSVKITERTGEWRFVKIVKS
jgi:DNA-directed RNA polymerase subunit RPC12/RpoP